MAAVAPHLRRAALALLCALLAACSPELDWRELASTEGRFSVLLPGKARRETRAVEMAAGLRSVTLFAYSQKDWSMGVAYWDYPDAAAPGTELDAARDALLRKLRGALRYDKRIAVAGRAGREVYAESAAGDLMLQARFVAVDKRAYQIAYFGAKNALAPADIDMLFSSFKLLD